jgi:Na+-transporting methylmalonyl-CoA/oxaloacetate decarboxylase gamma subunit
MDAQFVFNSLALLACFLWAESVLYRFAKRRGMRMAQDDFEEHEQALERRESKQARAQQEEQDRLREVISALLWHVAALQAKLPTRSYGWHGWYCEALGEMVEFVDPWKHELEIELAALTRAMELLVQMEAIAPRDVERYTNWVDAVYWRFVCWERETRGWVFFSPATLCEVARESTVQWVETLTWCGTPRETAIGPLVELLQESTTQYQQGLRQTLELLNCPERSWHETSKSFGRALSHWSKGQALSLMLTQAGRQDDIDLADPWTVERYSFLFARELERRIFDDLSVLHGAYLCKALKRLSSL